MAKWAWVTMVSVVSMTVAVGRANGAVQGKCLAAKTKCVSNKTQALLKCEQKAEKPGGSTDPNAAGCVDKARAKFDSGPKPEKGCFEKLENKTRNDCTTFDDTASAEALVEQCVADLVAAIDPPPVDQTKCGVGKKKCVAKKLKALFNCHRKAQAPGKPMDPNTGGCVDKVKAKFDGGPKPEKGCFVKLESKMNNDCLPPVENQADLEAVVDGCVETIVNALETPTVTTTTLGGTTTTSAGPATTTTTGASTTTTTLATSASCSANGLNVTVSIAYPESTLGGISAILLSVSYPPPLDIPGSGTATTVRQRVTSLAGAGSSVSPNDRDTNANAVDDRLDVTARSSTSGSINPGPVFVARYGCPSGTPIAASSMSCAQSQSTGLDGFPFPPELAGQITCSISVSSAP